MISSNEEKNRKALRLGRVFLFFFSIAMAIAFLIGTNLPKIFLMLNKSVETAGKIIELYPADHATIKYNYFVSGKEFISVDKSDFVGVRFISLRAGQEIKVFYDPSAPGNSCIGSPKDRFWNELFSVLVASLLVSAAIVFSLVKKQIII